MSDGRHSAASSKRASQERQRFGSPSGPKDLVASANVPDLTGLPGLSSVPLPLCVSSGDSGVSQVDKIDPNVGRLKGALSSQLCPESRDGPEQAPAGMQLIDVRCVRAHFLSPECLPARKI